eukprot:175846-Rhodomonas_salina.1
MSSHGVGWQDLSEPQSFGHGLRCIQVVFDLRFHANRTVDHGGPREGGYRQVPTLPKQSMRSTMSSAACHRSSHALPQEGET